MLSTFEWFDAEFFGEARLVFSANVLANVGSYGWVYDQVTARVQASGKVTLTGTYLKPQNLSVVMAEEFTCSISTNFKGSGVYFFLI